MTQSGTQPMTSSASGPVEYRSWTERPVVALCLDDACPWKHVPADVPDSLFIAQGKAAEHATTTGHSVRIYRELRRDVVPL